MSGFYRVEMYLDKENSELRFVYTGIIPISFLCLPVTSSVLYFTCVLRCLETSFKMQAISLLLA